HFNGFRLTRLFDDLSLVKIISHATLLQGFFDWTNVGFNIPSWSISVEFWTYIIFALCCCIHNGLFLSQLTLALICVVLLYTLSDPQSDFYGNALRSIAGFALGSNAYSILRKFEIKSFKTGIM